MFEQSDDVRLYLFLSPEATPEASHRYEIPMTEVRRFQSNQKELNKLKMDS